MLRAVLMIFILAFEARSATGWIKLTTPDFELYTSAGEKKGREAILHFEQVRGFFLKASPVKKTSGIPVRIIQFANLREFQPYAISASSVAFFASAQESDYIVMGDAGLGLPVATHEYMHLVIQHSGLRLPVWLNEGWADVYSTLRPMGKEAAVGDLLQSRINVLQRSQWLDFNALTSVTPGSPDYNEAARAGIFYAESWALAHMLYLAPEYQDNFGKFVLAVSQGKSSAESCQIAWGRTAGQVFADLRSYFDRKKILGRVFETQLATEQENPVVTDVSSFESQLVLAGVLAATNRVDQARAAYDRLEKEDAASPDLSHALGYFVLHNGDREGARKYLQKAFDAGDSDARTCFLLALLMREANRPAAEVIPALERAVKSQPDYTDARMQLGLMQIRARDFDPGIAGLMRIPNITPEHAPEVFCGLSYAYLQTGDLSSAAENRDTCGKWAKTDPQTRVVAALTRLIEGRSSAEAGVHPGEKLQQVIGVARNVDCSTSPHRLQILAGKNPLSFDLPDIAAIELTQTHGGVFTLACGPQNPVTVGIEFAPPRSTMDTGAGGRAGIVRRLEF